MRRISFLIAAHNEEKIIGKTLENLAGLPYENYEVIVGLDGCTDKTEEIVKEYSKKHRNFRCYNLNFRKGKHAVIDYIIKKSRGEIIFINDADWIFTVKGRKHLQDFLKIFDNKKIGGIAESFPAEWEKEKIRRGNTTYKMVAYGTYFWIKFLKDNFMRKENGHLIITEPSMFLTNIFRKKLYKPSHTLGDDFERTKHIIEQGYDVAIFNNEDIPRMISSYDNINLRDLFKQKVRTAIARKQLKTSNNFTYGNSLRMSGYIFREAWKMGISIGFMVTFWLLVLALGEIFSKFKKLDTKSGWQLRAKR